MRHGRSSLWVHVVPTKECRVPARAVAGRSSLSGDLLEWLAGTGCSRVAIHFDVDTIDSDEIVLGVGPEPGGLISDQVRRIISDTEGATEVVGLTIAEFIPRQVVHLRQILQDFPLIDQAPAPS